MVAPGAKHQSGQSKKTKTRVYTDYTAVSTHQHYIGDSHCNTARTRAKLIMFYSRNVGKSYKHPKQDESVACNKCHYRPDSWCGERNLEG